VLRDPRRREMENRFECLRSLFRCIPSLEIAGASGFCPRNAGGGALVS
jgi:myosin-crossreactive antigen